MPIRRTLSTHTRWIGKSLPALLAVTIAVDGWLTMGPLAQSTLIAAAVLKRLAGMWGSK